MVTENLISNTLIAHENLITEERWNNVLQYKKSFLQNDTEDPRGFPHLNQNIALSWIRSRAMGIDPYKEAVEKSLSPQELSRIMNKNRHLIEITTPLVNTFRDLVISPGFVLQLFDKNSVTLLQEGEWLPFPPFMNPDTRKYIAWDESVLGTTAHTLSIQLKRPIQLLGPENYNVAFHNNIATAAPIFDKNGDVTAVLVLVQPLVSLQWDGNIQNMYSNTLGLITAMAVAIQTQTELMMSYRSLEEARDQLEQLNSGLTTVNNTLEATLASVDEGIITIDRTGRIININQEGNRILNLKDTKNRYIQEFLGGQSRLMQIVESGDQVTDQEETICINNNEHHYLVNVRPVLNQRFKQVDVAVLRLNHIEKINSLVTRRSGATATFQFEDIIGNSKAIKSAITRAQCFASSPENVLLIGESGTGKELFAQAIHNRHRPQGPFMAVNCAAMPRNLIESELFGYEGGSFTGSERSGRPGKIELANGGTLFLDEIGDMPLELQAVLLRTLEDKQVMRIGGRAYKKVDFRLIAATNKDLFKMVKQNLFREDLYFRLSVLCINIPPLRERENDTEVLSNYFVENYCRKMNWKIPKIDPGTLKVINEYNWPGNVRQLENAMIYAVNIPQKGSILPQSLPDYILLDSISDIDDEPENHENNETKKPDRKPGHTLKDNEKSAIRNALIQANNNVSMAAVILGISKSSMYRKIKEYNIK